MGTITEIYDYLRLLFASIGVPHCPKCGRAIARQSAEQIVQRVMSLTPEDRVMVLAPIVRGRKGEFKKEMERLVQHGFTRARIDGELVNLEDDIPLDKRRNHTIEVVIDRLLVKPGIEHRLELSVGLAMKLAGGLVQVAVVGGEEQLYSAKLACPDCGISVPQLEPRSFSFNSSYGACPECHGLGSRYEFDPARVITDWSKPLLDGGLGPGSASQNLIHQLHAEAQAGHRVRHRDLGHALPLVFASNRLLGRRVSQREVFVHGEPDGGQAQPVFANAMQDLDDERRFVAGRQRLESVAGRPLSRRTGLRRRGRRGRTTALRPAGAGFRRAQASACSARPRAHRSSAARPVDSCSGTGSAAGDPDDCRRGGSVRRRWRRRGRGRRAPVRRAPGACVSTRAADFDGCRKSPMR